MTRLGLLPNTLKDALEQDAEGTLRALARLGIAGVEKPVAAAAGDDLPETIGISIGWDAWPDGWDHLQEGAEWSPDRIDEVIPGIVERAREAGVRFVGLFWGPADNRDQVLRLAGMLEAMGQRLHAHGLTFYYHNHDHEFTNAWDGERAIDLLLANTEHVAFELDLGWVRYGGQDPAAFVRQCQGRVPLIHLRDVADPDERGKFALPGTGVLDLPDVIAACEEAGAEWVILEPHKHDDLDPMEFITASVLNLRALGAMPGAVRTTPA